MLYGVYWSVPFVPAITNISQIIDVLAEVRELDVGQGNYLGTLGLRVG